MRRVYNQAQIVGFTLNALPVHEREIQVMFVLSSYVFNHSVISSRIFAFQSLILSVEGISPLCKTREKLQGRAYFFEL